MFYIISDTWQLLNGQNLISFKFNLMGPSKSILHMPVSNLRNKSYFILHKAPYDLLANFYLLH